MIAPAATRPAVPTAPVVEVLGGLAEAVSRLRAQAPVAEAGSWANELRDEAITALDTAVKELTLYRGRLLLVHKETGRWGTTGDRDFPDWRARQTGAGRGAAVGELRLAEGLEEMPAVAEAVEQGRLSLEHAKALDRLRRQASPQVERALTNGALDELIATGADGMSAPQLDRHAKAWAARIDARAAQEDFDTVRERRSLVMRNYAGGVKGEFFLDHVAATELRTALDAINGVPAKDEKRTGEQRLADALSMMAARTLQVGADLNGAQVRPHIALLVREETWAAVVARRLAMEQDEAQVPPLPDVPPAELEDGAVVPLRELEQIMCDSEITRVVMNAEGVPLDVGRTQRTYSKELRRAVITRDRHCMWPGCTIRGSWCQVHHITWYSRGGRTSVAEGWTGCSFHHHLVHREDIRITVLPDGFDYHYPDGRHIGTTRRSDPLGELRPPVPTRTPAKRGSSTTTSACRAAPGSPTVHAAVSGADAPRGTAVTDPRPRPVGPRPGRGSPRPGRGSPRDGRADPRQEPGGPRSGRAGPQPQSVAAYSTPTMSTTKTSVSSPPIPACGTPRGP